MHTNPFDAIDWKEEAAAMRKAERLPFEDRNPVTPRWAAFLGGFLAGWIVACVVILVGLWRYGGQ